MQLKQIEKQRKKIDEIDKKILGLTSKRIKTVKKIAAIKKAENLPVKDAEREKTVKNKWGKNAEEFKVNKKIAMLLLKKTLEESKEIQESEIKQNIAFQGTEGSFSEIAAGKLFLEGNILPCKSFQEVFKKVEEGKVFLGIIPVENSITGRIIEPTDLMACSKLKVCGEIVLPVKHSLIAKKNQKISEIKKVFAHPEALRQCSNFLGNLKKAELIAWFDGAGATKKIKQSRNAALIASGKIAEKHNLKILKENIQDTETNSTRFLVIGKKIAKETGNDKTTMFFKIPDAPGKLHKILGLPAKTGINLTKLESIPNKKKIGEYLFWMDFEGHQNEKKISAILNKMKKQCISMKLLGSYPKWDAKRE